MNSATAPTTIMMRLPGRTAAGVPRWAVWTAYATALTVLPSGIWRIAAMNFGVPLVEHGTPPPGSHAPVVFDAQWWYIVELSVVSEAVAFLTGQSAVFYLTYAPLALWGPLLAVVAVHYYRRRTGDRADPRGGGSARSGRRPGSAGGFGIGGR
ncbi:hypothetical protein [Nonomuraea dietziae]|uniref:hypothetical protein n=1 Tax=Nonomuraea dietziae TaxID=65515 RepID=UPI003439DEB8